MFESVKVRLESGRAVLVRIRKTSTMRRKKRNSEDPLDTNRRQSQTRAGQDDQARVDERLISANPGLKVVPLFVFTFQCIA